MQYDVYLKTTKKETKGDFWGGKQWNVPDWLCQSPDLHPTKHVFDLFKPKVRNGEKRRRMAGV